MDPMVLVWLFVHHYYVAVVQVTMTPTNNKISDIWILHWKALVVAIDCMNPNKHCHRVSVMQEWYLNAIYLCMFQVQSRTLHSLGFHDLFVNVFILNIYISILTHAYVLNGLAF